MRVVLVAGALAVLFSLSTQLMGARQAQDLPGSSELTAEEEKQAADLAAAALRDRGLLKGKVYLSKLEVFRDAAANGSRRQVFVTHFRYDGHEAVQTRVDLTRGAVTAVEVLPNFPTPLARE